MNRKSSSVIIIGGVIAIVVAILAMAMTTTTTVTEPVIIDNTTATYATDIGLTVNTPNQTVSLRQLDQAFTTAASTDVKRTNIYIFWNIIEPEQGVFDWKQTDVLMGLAEKNDFNVTLFFSVVNGRILGPFPDWMDDPTIDTIGAERLADTLDAILLRYHIVDTVIIGGSTESQFRDNEHNISSYKNLFNESYNILKERHPDVMFGNSFALHNVINSDLDYIVDQLVVGDVIAFSYIPVDSLNDIIKTPAEAAKDMDRAVELADGKQIGFLEVIWSTSDFVSGSEDSQHEFVKEIFEFYSENESEIEFMTWGRLYDRHNGTCASEEQNIGSETVTIESDSILGTNEFVIERLDRYICNSGFIDVNGQSKPAFDEFKNQIGLINSK